ncbi:urease accessory protein UreF [Methylobacter psychrophilus]|uniref:urease accessory protein UreF n=1 Tax=Methylobacter psychrophilus TaxID=96941 RepID=UPI0021D4BBB0|nr:urease accessory protein UreF [Methylobacter psychrophilus]
MINDLALLRLLQLISPGLPIGMYSYSQGLERAIDDGLVTNADEVHEWLEGLLVHGMTQLDLPVMARLFDAWTLADNAAVVRWSKTLNACRETSELRAEDRQTGQALARLLVALELDEAQVWLRKPEATLATLFSLAAVRWAIPKREAAIGYLWSWLENQVLCAVKLVPLGQVAGQRLLIALASSLPEQVNRALLLADDDIGGSVFGLALASSRHETQYSRLFRS